MMNHSLYFFSTIAIILSFVFATPLKAISNIDSALNIERTSEYAVATWIKRDSVNCIRASTYTTGGGWTTPVTVSNPNMECSHPVVSVNENGDAVILWIYRDKGSSVNILASSTLESGPEESWSVPRDISIIGIVRLAKNSLIDTTYDVKLSNTGNLTATWTARVGSELQIFAATGTMPEWTGLSVVQISDDLPSEE